MSLFAPIFDALNREGVRYIVVGGVAVVLQGHLRLTVDLDLIVDLEPNEARKAIGALTALGFRPRVPVPAHQFAEPEVRKSWIREKGMQVFTMLDFDNPLRTVDLFVDHPIAFEELWERSQMLALGETEVRVACTPDLIRLKQLSGRSKDLEDIERLKQILAQREETV